MIKPTLFCDGSLFSSKKILWVNLVIYSLDKTFFAWHLYNRNRHFGTGCFGTMYLLVCKNRLYEIAERYWNAISAQTRRIKKYYPNGYWDRKGENEIDIIAVNELTKVADMIEVKRNASNIDMEKLAEKSTCFCKSTGELTGCKINLKGSSMINMWKK